MWILRRRNLPLLLCTGPLRVGRCSHLQRKAHADAVQGVHDLVLRPAAGVALRMLRRHGRQAAAAVILHHAGVPFGRQPRRRIARPVWTRCPSLPLLRRSAAEVDAGVPAVHLAGVEFSDQLALAASVTLVHYGLVSTSSSLV